MPSTVAIVPARAGSKRLPNKNHREFLGKPLVLWSIDFALMYSGFDHVVVSTDSAEVIGLARAAGVSVPWVRPAELSTDTATSIDVVIHALDALASEGKTFDRVALLQPTSPVRLEERWDEAAVHLDRGASAAIGVQKALTHPYWTYFIGQDSEITPCFPDSSQTRSQDLPMAYVPNGSLYLCRTVALRQHRTFAPSGTRGILCTDPIETIDIDTEDDWSEAERLISKRLR